MNKDPARRGVQTYHLCPLFVGIDHGMLGMIDIDRHHGSVAIGLTPLKFIAVIGYGGDYAR